MQVFVKVMLGYNTHHYSYVSPGADTVDINS